MVYQVCKALGAEQAAQEILAHITKTAPHFLESIGEPLAVPKYNLI
jgi:hypothetical protein